ncbi:NADH:flavin oxidoreductase [Oceanospirillum maris]|uniref:oxidoreductase n=1 Tax=Oceanospirillum maris TaxID=64977 RepID=UPI0004056387|nr:NADH:flavin oxidoreductase [Oceanospirillum maris]
MGNVSVHKFNEEISFGKNVFAKNRLFFASMGLDLCDDSGYPKEAFFSLYQSLIKGGCGFGYLCNASVTSASRFNSRGLKLTTEQHAHALRPLFNWAKSNNFILGVQLQHYGMQGDGVALSPSGVSLRNGNESIAMSEEQIQDCIEQFVISAIFAQKANAPIIQLQAANGYLLSSFLSPKTNLRQDFWGGTPLKRANIVISIIKEIIKATDGQIPVSVRLGIDDGFLADGQKPHLLKDVIFAFEEAGVASIECSVGVSDTFSQFFSNTEETLSILRKGTKLLKEQVKIPVGFSGSVFSVSKAKEILESGDADFVGFARAVLADNHLVVKELNGFDDDVNRCLGDAFCFRDKKETSAERVYCCVNPDYLRPDKLKVVYKGK